MSSLIVVKRGASGWIAYCTRCAWGDNSMFHRVVVDASLAHQKAHEDQELLDAHIEDVKREEEASKTNFRAAMVLAGLLFATFLLLLIWPTGAEGADFHSIRPRVMLAHSPDGTGTAFIIGPNRVLTVAHMVTSKGVWLSHNELTEKEAEKLWKGTPPVKVLKVDKDLDLALLEYPTTLPEVRFRSPDWDEPVITVGFPKTLLRVAHGRVQRVEPGQFVLDVASAAGCSGSPVFSEHTNHVLGIMSMIWHDTVGVPANGVVTGTEGSGVVVIPFRFNIPFPRDKAYIAVTAPTIVRFLNGQ